MAPSFGLIQRPGLLAVSADAARRCTRAAMALLVAMLATTAWAQAPQSRFAEVNGVRMHYLVAGQGDPIILMHGYAQTSHMWRPLIQALSKNHLVIAPDLRGFGESGVPPSGYTKKVMAQDVHALPPA